MNDCVYQTHEKGGVTQIEESRNEYDEKCTEAGGATTRGILCPFGGWHQANLQMTSKDLGAQDGRSRFVPPVQFD